MKKGIFLIALTIIITSVNAQAPINVPDNIGGGNCLEFAGVNGNYVDCGNSSSLYLGSVFSYECWVYPYSQNQGGIVYRGDGYDETGGFGIRIDSPTWTYQIDIYDLFNPPGYWITNVSADINEWQHLMVVYDGTNVHFYKNGVLSESTAATGTILNTTNNFYIGSRKRTHLVFDGKIDEVRIWNVARTQAQIQENMCKQLTGVETGLIGYWKMNEGTDNTCSGGEDVCDQTSNGNHGTMQ